MALTRRQFLKLGSIAAVASVFPTRLPLSGSSVARASTLSQVALTQFPYVKLRKFTQPLRGLGPGGIQVAVPDLSLAPITNAVHYSIDVLQFQDKLHPDLSATTLWGYNPTRALNVKGTPTPSHLGGVIVAARNVPIQITVTNKLPSKHILPVDVSKNFPDTRNQNALSTHLHGGFVPWISDGGPMAWFTPNGRYGPSAKLKTGKNIYQVLNPDLKPGQAEYYYPNQQSARMMWYHDHAHDITRLNAYAGVASAYIIRDLFEASLIPKGLPIFAEAGGNEIPLIIQDKVFVGDNVGTFDPDWATLKLPSNSGSLWYPHIYDPLRWELGTVQPDGNPPDPSCVPEMFGNTMLANGVVYPFAPVQPRRYRLRVLNACNARFLNLQLYVDDGSPDGVTLGPDGNPTNRPGPSFLVIGNEGGFLPRPVVVPSGVPFSTRGVDGGAAVVYSGSLFTAPAERWDLLVDFKGFEGKRVILYNDAPAPFPQGDPLYDYFPGAPNPQPVTTEPGFGPNTRQIMRFDVGKTVTKPVDLPLKITESTSLSDGIDKLLVPVGVTTPPPGVPVRRLTLNESFDGYGRLIQLLGTDVDLPSGSGSFGRGYMETATENPKVGSTEIWQIINLTGDSHPIHFHLVNCQIISRQPFDVDHYLGGAPTLTGTARPPDVTEAGWKETVRMHPGEVTTVIMRFRLPVVPFRVPFSPNEMLGAKGYEYVWHCHILDHEEHDMMRPMVVVP